MGDSRASEAAYWYLDGDDVHGPFSRAQYDALVADGTIDDGTIDDGTLWWSDDPEDVPQPAAPDEPSPAEPLAVWWVAVLLGAYGAYQALFLPLFACSQWGRTGTRRAFWDTRPVRDSDVDVVALATGLGPGSELHRAVVVGGLLFLLAAWLRRGATAAWFLALVTSVVFVINAFQGANARWWRGQLGPEPFAVVLGAVAIGLLLSRRCRRWCRISQVGEGQLEAPGVPPLEPPSGIRLLTLPMAVMAVGLGVWLPLAGRAHAVGTRLHGIEGTTVPPGLATMLAIALGLAAALWAWATCRGLTGALVLAWLRGLMELAVGFGAGGEGPRPDRLMPALIWLGALLLPSTRAWGRRTPRRRRSTRSRAVAAVQSEEGGAA